MIQVRAFDQDLGVNDAVLYDILSGNLEINGVDSFAINNETGVIYVNTPTLDRETYQQYMLIIRVTYTCQQSVSQSVTHTHTHTHTHTLNS